MKQNKNTKTKIKVQDIKHPEQGRSMVEMLGTLAIMGVLSIGGIAGYTYAVTKHKANETMEELNKRAVVYSAQVLYFAPEAGKILVNGEYGDKTALGYSIKAKNSYYPNEFEVTLTNYPSEVCRDLLKNYTIPFQIVVNNKVYDPKSDNYTICGKDGETAPETMFVYKTDLNQGKEAFQGITSDPLYEYTYTEEIAEFKCKLGQEFLANNTCYPCDTPTAFHYSGYEEYTLCKACGRKATSSICFKECILGQEFRDSDYDCIPCENEGSYGIGSEEDYALCRACGHRSIHQEGEIAFCTPGCMSGQVYDTQEKKCITPECSQNSDCADKGSNYYCKLDFDIGGFGLSCEQKPLYGRCVKATEGTRKDVTGVGTYVKSADTMNWWSAQNYCQALGGTTRMATVADFGCGYDYVGANKTGYCNINTSTSYSGTRSANMQAFQTAFGKSNWYWLNDSYSACSAYLANLSHGEMYSNNRTNLIYALCRVGD